MRRKIYLNRRQDNLNDCLNGDVFVNDNSGLFYIYLHEFNTSISWVAIPLNCHELYEYIKNNIRLTDVRVEIDYTLSTFGFPSVIDYRLSSQKQQQKYKPVDKNAYSKIELFGIF